MTRRYGYERRRDPATRPESGTDLYRGAAAGRDEEDVANAGVEGSQPLDPRSRLGLPQSMESLEDTRRTLLLPGGWIDDYMASSFRDTPHIFLVLDKRTGFHPNIFATAPGGQDVSIGTGTVLGFELVDGLVPNESYLAPSQSNYGRGNYTWQSRPLPNQDFAPFTKDLTSVAGKGFSMEFVMKWLVGANYPSPSAGPQALYDSSNISGHRLSWRWDPARNSWHIIMQVNDVDGNRPRILDAPGGADAFANKVRHVAFRFRSGRWIDLWIDGVRVAVHYLSPNTEQIIDGTIGQSAGLFYQRRGATAYCYAALQYFAHYRYPLPQSSIQFRAKLVKGEITPTLAST